MTLISKGDQKAFEHVYQSYFKVLLNYAREILKDNFLAEEAIQEVFIKLWQQRETIKIEQSLKSYLFKSTFHYCVNHLKHIKVEDKFKAFFLHHVPMGDSNEALSEDFPLAGLLESELEQIIARAIDSLPDQCRRVFLMSRNENLKHEVIAQKLDVSVNTVHTQILRALTKLRIEIKKYVGIFF
jgi:RNA polymerase sigma-70 factor (ECF subfamily)